MRSVVVPLDGSELAERALPHAVALAQRLDARLVLVTHRSGGVVIDPIGYLQRCADTWGRPDATVLSLEEDYPARAIARLAAELPATTVVMSTRGRGRLRTVALGSVAEEVVRSVEVPVLLVGPSCAAEPEPLEQLLLTVEGPAPRPGALQLAEAWGRGLGVPIRLLSVVPTSATGEEVERMRAELGRQVAASGAVAAPVRVSVLRGEDVSEAISAFADAQPGALVVLLTSGRTAGARLRRGSTTNDVVRRAHAPVLVLHEPGGG